MIRLRSGSEDAEGAEDAEAQGGGVDPEAVEALG